MDQSEFDGHGSEIEAAARAGVAADAACILERFPIPIGTGETIRERDW